MDSVSTPGAGDHAFRHATGGPEQFRKFWKQWFHKFIFEFIFRFIIRAVIQFRHIWTHRADTAG